jgi:hypothetical protein
MAGFRSDRMSENDVLIEMRRLRGEIPPVRERLEPRRASSFVTTGPTTGQLRRRSAGAICAVLTLLVLGGCWLVYRALSAVMGGVFDGIVPEPVHATVNAVVGLVYALI